MSQTEIQAIDNLTERLVETLTELLNRTLAENNVWNGDANGVAQQTATPTIEQLKLQTSGASSPLSALSGAFWQRLDDPDIHFLLLANALGLHTTENQLVVPKTGSVTLNNERLLALNYALADIGKSLSVVDDGVGGAMIEWAEPSGGGGGYATTTVWDAATMPATSTVNLSDLKDTVFILNNNQGGSKTVTISVDALDDRHVVIRALAIRSSKTLSIQIDTGGAPYTQYNDNATTHIIIDGGVIYMYAEYIVFDGEDYTPIISPYTND